MEDNDDTNNGIGFGISSEGQKTLNDKFKGDLKKVLGIKRKNNRLRKQLAKRSPRNAFTANPSFATSVLAGGSGNQSPFTETDRTLHPEQILTSSDGFFSLVFQNVESITSLDVNNETEVRNYDDPIIEVLP